MIETSRIITLVLGLAALVSTAQAWEMAQVNEIRALADLAPSSAQHDRIILDHAARLEEVLSYRKLVVEARSSDTKAQLVYMALRFLRNISDVQGLALDAPNATVHDNVLLHGQRLCRSVRDIRCLVDVARWSETKVSLLNSGLALAGGLQDIIWLAKLSPNSTQRDQILLQGVPFCSSASDAGSLAAEASTAATKQAIAAQYSRRARFSSLFGSR